MMVKQEHARILREAVAKLTKLGNPFVTSICVGALQQYARAIKPTCECVDTVFIATENKAACLDCGRRHGPVEQPQLFLAPSPPTEEIPNGPST